MYEFSGTETLLVVQVRGTKIEHSCTFGERREFGPHNRLPLTQVLRMGN